MNKKIAIIAIAKGILIGGIPAICFIAFSFWASQRWLSEEVSTRVTAIPAQSFLPQKGIFANVTSEHKIEHSVVPPSPEIDIPLIDDSDNSTYEIPEYEIPEYEAPDSGWPAEDPPPELDSSLHQPIREFYRDHWSDPAMREKWHEIVENSRQRLLKELAVAETVVPAAQDIDRKILELHHFLVELGADPFVTGGKSELIPEVQEARARVWKLEKDRADYWSELEGMASILFDEETDDVLGSWLTEKAGWVDAYLGTSPAWLSEFYNR